MLTIAPLRPDQIEEARLMIYRTRHALGVDAPAWDDALAHYRAAWPLPDLDDFLRGYVKNRGVFLATLDDGRVVGTGALRPYSEDPALLPALDGDTAELRRFWLLPEYQSHGHGYRMLQTLLAAARGFGYARVVLETHRAYQHRAWALYTRCGFTEIPRYGDDPDDVGMMLIL